MKRLHRSPLPPHCFASRSGNEQDESASCARCERSGLALVAGLLVWAATPAQGQLTHVGNHRIVQSLIGGTVEEGDHFGGELAGGDFDGDGFCDLAIGTPDKDVNAISNAGAFYVVYGSAAGLGGGPDGPLLIHQDVPNVEGAAEDGDRFGARMIAGDFNGDGNDELVVGISSEDVGAIVDAGAIQQFFGTPGGLTTQGDALFTGGQFINLGDHQGQRFGASLATGYLQLTGTDSRLDLLVGIPGGALAPTIDGSFLMMAGSPTGLGLSGYFHAFLGTEAGPGDRIGAAVAVGDVNGDGLPGDMIIGAPFADLASGDDTGIVWIRAEAAFGDQPVPLGPGPGSHFGESIALGDFRGAGYDQVLLGAPDADVDLEQDAGAVVLYDEMEQTFAYITQDPARFFGSPDPFDRFGRVLAVGDFDGDGFDDAAFGVPDEDLTASGGGGSIVDAGAVQVLHGSSTGLRYDTNQFWELGGPIGYFNFPGHRFGAALAACDFNGDGADDLAIGFPGGQWLGSDEAGIVQILYGYTAAIFSDDFESGDTSAWS